MGNNLPPQFGGSSGEKVRILQQAHDTFKGKRIIQLQHSSHLLWTRMFHLTVWKRTHQPGSHRRKVTLRRFVLVARLPSKGSREVVCARGLKLTKPRSTYSRWPLARALSSVLKERDNIQTLSATRAHDKSEKVVRLTPDARKQSTWCDLTVGHGVSANGAYRHGLHCSWQSTSVRNVCQRTLARGRTVHRGQDAALENR